MGQLFFVGDSITTGAWDERGGWANRLISEIMALNIPARLGKRAFYCLPYNLGVSGDDVPKVLARLEREITARNEGESRDTTEIVIYIGANDAVWLRDEQCPAFADAEFAANIERLADKALALADRVSFLGLLPVEDELLDPPSFASHMTVANRYVKPFEDIIARACHEKGIRFFPLFDAFLALPNWQSLLIDGEHPNSEGHAKLADLVHDFVINDDFRKFHS